jgi:hypothetical protein
MIAFQKNLVAAADAHHLMSEFGEAGGGVAGAEGEVDYGAEDENLCEFAVL